MGVEKQSFPRPEIDWCDELKGLPGDHWLLVVVKWGMELFIFEMQINWSFLATKWF